MRPTLGFSQVMPSGMSVAWLVPVALLGVGAAIVVPVAWARWLRRRLPMNKLMGWLPNVVTAVLLAPLVFGLPPLLGSVLRVLQAVPHVRPADQGRLLRFGLGECLELAKYIGLALAVLSVICLIVLATVTVFQGEALRRRTPSG